MIVRRSLHTMKVTTCLILGASAFETIGAQASRTRIEMRRDRVVVDRDGKSFIGPPTYVVPLAGKRLLLAQPRGLPIVMDSLGNYLKTLGRAGGGPGEFVDEVGPIRIGAGDTLYI